MSPQKKLCLLFIIISLCSSCATFQKFGKSKKFYVYGYVVAQDSTAIQGARVYGYIIQDSTANPTRLNPKTEEVTTDSAGYFKISKNLIIGKKYGFHAYKKIDVGVIDITFQLKKPHYIRIMMNMDNDESVDYANREKGQNFGNTRSSTTSNSHNVISGKVVDRDGNPLAGIKISIDTLPNSNVESNEKGYFNIPTKSIESVNLAEQKKYTVKVEYKDYQPGNTRVNLSHSEEIRLEIKIDKSIIIKKQ